MPPEFPVCTQKLDIYMFGLTLNEIFGGEHDLNESETINITKLAEYFMETIIECTNWESSLRPDALKLKNHFLVIQKLMLFLLAFNCENYWNMKNEEKDGNFKKSYELIMQTIKQYNLTQ